MSTLDLMTVPQAAILAGMKVRDMEGLVSAGRITAHNGYISRQSLSQWKRHERDRLAVKVRDGVEEGWVRQAEAARATGKSRAAIYDLVRRGRIEVTVVDGTKYVNPEEIRAMIHLPDGPRIARPREDLLRPCEVARLLGQDRKSVLYRINKQGMPHEVHDGRPWVRQADVFWRPTKETADVE